MSEIEFFQSRLCLLEDRFHELKCNTDGKEYKMLAVLDKCVDALVEMPNDKTLIESIRKGIDALIEILHFYEKKNALPDSEPDSASDESDEESGSESDSE